MTRLLTWNVQWCCGQDGRVDPARIVEHARAFADFDILCLQEVAIGYDGLPGGADGDQAQRLGALLPGFECHFGAAVLERDASGRWRQFGNLIASRLPVLHVRHHTLPYPAEAGCQSMPRSCTAAVVRAPFGPLRVMTTHLEYYSGVQRRAQVEAIRELHREACSHVRHPPAAGDPAWPFAERVHSLDAVVCGDWNMEAHHPEYRRMLDPIDDTPAWVDAWTVAHPGVPHAPTFQVHDHRYSPTPLTVDFVFTSRSLAPRVADVRVDTVTQASDHQPVLLSLQDG